MSRRWNVGIVSLFLSAAVFANGNNNDINTKKYCYYNSVEYSKGSFVKQAKGIKQCSLKNESGELIWVNI